MRRLTTSYLKSDLYKLKREREERKQMWKGVDKETFPWHKPEVAMDFGYQNFMTEKVFYLQFLLTLKYSNGDLHQINFSIFMALSSSTNVLSKST